ncbi:hypothetical protein ACAW74_14895 [Fibrella sp. WM1]|uniref:hypothetical protein n=1 Tax=Fibrella musci TaxID=3242485 RepID=UPI00352126F4
MSIRLPLFCVLSCLLQPDGVAQTFHEKYETMAKGPAPRPESRPVALSVTPAVARPWVRLMGQLETDGKIKLRWHTNYAKATRSFRVERSADGLEWNALGEVNSTDSIQRNAYQFVDEAPVRTAVYRLQSKYDDGSTPYSAVLSVVNPRHASQPVLYYSIDQRVVLIGLEPMNLIYPLTANLYAESGRLLCYDTIPPQADEFRIDVPATRESAVKVQIVDGAHRVVTVRRIWLSK